MGVFVHLGAPQITWKHRPEQAALISNSMMFAESDSNVKRFKVEDAI